MPDKKMAFKCEKCSRGKLSKQYITVIVGWNMYGMDKLKTIIIGKSQNPHCFKNVKNLAFDYLSQAKAWMTLDIFIKQVPLDWWTNEKKSPRKYCVSLKTFLPIPRISQAYKTPN